MPASIIVSISVTEKVWLGMSKLIKVFIVNVITASTNAMMLTRRYMLGLAKSRVCLPEPYRQLYTAHHTHGASRSLESGPPRDAVEF